MGFRLPALNQILTVFLTLHLTRNVVSENILFLQTCSSYSHRTSVWPVVEALAEKGHNVTFMSAFPHLFPSKNPNITDIVPVALNDYMKELLRSTFDVSHRAKGIVPPMWLVLELYCYSTCNILLQTKELQEWITTTPQVDLIIADLHPDCAHGLSQALKSKSILMLPIPISNTYSDIFGIPHEASSIPEIDITLKTPLSLWKRMVGNILPLWYKLVKDVTYSFFYKAIFKDYLKLDEQANFEEMNANLSLIMVNADYLEDYSRSDPPFVVKVPGLHVKSKDQLPPLDSDLERFINSVNSTNTKPEGFIYISLGTVLNAGSMPHQIRDVFFNTIKKFPNIRFIWRWTGDFPEKNLLPENLLLRSWLNQQALLAHPKIKGFMFQAGRPSMEEAMRFGVPTIAFPMVCDQDFNSYRLEALGSSITLELSDLQLKSELLYDSVNAILTNPKYSANSKRIMNVARDVPIPPVEKALWWIEYVLRHTKEDLNLLKSPSQQLTWYQRRDLDVWAINAFVFYIAMHIFLKLARKVIHKLYKGLSFALNHSNQKSKAKQS